MTARFQKGLLIFFIIGIAALLYGLWTTTPRAPKPGSCKILEEKFCKQGKIVKSDNFIYIGFNLPPGTAIFAPVDGQVSKAKINQPSPFQGFFAGIQDRSQNPPVSYSFNGDLQFPNMTNKNLTSGTAIGVIDNTGTTNLGDYNLVIGISKPDVALGRFVSAEDILRKLFPTAFET